MTYHPPGRRAVLGTLGTLAAMAVMVPTQKVLAQPAFPAKPITLIVPFPPGGATDTQFRALATAAAKDLKQPIIVANQPGAAGTLAPGNMARNAAPDGYTLAVIASSIYRMPHVQPVAYDAVKDFTYVAGISEFIFGVVVPTESPFKSIHDLIAAAKSKPGQLSVGSISNGSSGHVALMRWAKLAGFEVNFIPFKGGADAMQALLGGHINAMSDSSWGPLVQQGRLRALAVYESNRNKQFPTVPTMKELGWDVTTNSVVGLAGPKGMDPQVVQQLQNAFKGAIDDSAFHKALESNGQSVGYMDSSSYTSFIARQFEVERRNVEDLKAAGVQLGT